MRYALAVKVISCFDDLGEDITSLIFAETLVWALFDTFEEVVRRATGEFGRA
jgi:hypothetical protein